MEIGLVGMHGTIKMCAKNHRWAATVTYRFCPNDGLPLELIDRPKCSCGADIVGGASFCTECGKEIADEFKQDGSVILLTAV